MCETAFVERYSDLNGHKRRVRKRLEEELALIDELGLAGFFLLHWEVLELAREVALEVRGPGSMRHVLPPGRGRGSSVGSLVCYLTGLSHVDPVANNLSLGRFLNRELASVPDIDLDFPRDIREKLIVRVVERYGSEHASLVAAFATYRSRGAIRDVGKALGLPYADLERLARLTDGWNAQRVADEIAALPDAATKLRSPRWRAFGALCAEIAGLPRHISQHPGGMVISSRPLVELVPVQPAAMEGRQMCQWDKDSCADAGFLKIDLLGLGMLSAVEECVDLIARHRGERIDLSRVRLDDPDVFAEIQRADTVGCFQIESRAQMQVILRTRPETIDDITVQVALVRPGPIQGKAVHPYVERRQKLRDDPGYRAPADHPLLEEPLRETLGVVVFQDQVLDVAVHLAGFTVGEAEGLRRAMSRKRSHAALEAWRERFVAGALEKGVEEPKAHELYDKLVAFSGFGFPKSHAAAFGLLAYQSAWLRHHYAPEFLAALLNAQPMGFYPPATLVRDGQRHGVETRPPDVNRSDAGCTIEDGAVRVGLKYVTGLGEDDAEAVAAKRPYSSIRELAQRTGLSEDELRALAESGACDCFGLRRRELLWQLGLVPRPASVPGTGGEAKQLALPLEPTVATPELPEPTVWERMLTDYRTTSLSVGVHPLELLRPHLPPGTLSSEELREQPHRAKVQLAGLVVARQRPSTANGVVFMLLEDELAQVNLVVLPQVYERFRAVVRSEPLLLVRGRYEHSDRNRNILVDELVSLAPLARSLTDGARRPRGSPAGAPLRAPLTSALTSRLSSAIGRVDWGRALGGGSCRAIRRDFMSRVLGVRALVAAPLVALVCFAISAAGAGAAAPTGTRVVAPKPLLPRGAKPLGAVSPTATVSGAVVLQPRDEAALTHFISQVTDKHSPLFHHYLTPGSFAARFGPTPVDHRGRQVAASVLRAHRHRRRTGRPDRPLRGSCEPGRDRLPHGSGALPARQRLDRPGAHRCGPACRRRSRSTSRRSSASTRPRGSDRRASSTRPGRRGGPMRPRRPRASPTRPARPRPAPTRRPPPRSSAA